MVEKVKLFIFSNSYTARVLLRCLEHMKPSDLEIIIPSELGVSNGIGLTIHAYATLQQCVEACTRILIVCNETIPKNKIDLISTLANFYNKCCIIVPGFRDKQKDFPIINELKRNISEKPLILIISYGTKTQISCWEIMVYRLLFDNDIKFFAFPSSELKDVLQWLTLCDIANNLCFDRFVSESACEVEVRCLEYDPIENNEINDILFRINPDVMIVSICNNYDNYDEIRNIFKFRYKQIIDIFVKSELIEIVNDIGEKRLIFDFTSFCNETNSGMKLSDRKLFNRLSKIIFPKIALPNDVSII